MSTTKELLKYQINMKIILIKFTYQSPRKVRIINMKLIKVEILDASSNNVKYLLDQLILRTELSKSRSCTVLSPESITHLM